MKNSDNIWPLSEQLIELILSQKPMHRKFMQATLAEITSDERNSAETYISFLLNEGWTLEEVSNSYITVIQDMFREELYFMQTGRYRCSSYIEALEFVYNNDEYMQKYMVGLGLSSYWWINHVQMLRFFRRTLPANRGGVYREIGPGHGLYLLEAMKISSFESFEGVDISETSVGLTNRIINSGHFGRFSKAQIWQGDFLAEEFDAPADALVMGEILEHVEDPALFLRRAYEVTTSTAHIFLTTCINSPAVDHIYNPGSLEGLEAIIQSSGFDISDKIVLPKQGFTIEECVKSRLSVNIALVIEKNDRGLPCGADDTLLIKK